MLIKIVHKTQGKEALCFCFGENIHLIVDFHFDTLTYPRLSTWKAPSEPEQLKLIIVLKRSYLTAKNRFLRLVQLKIRILSIIITNLD